MDWDLFGKQVDIFGDLFGTGGGTSGKTSQTVTENKEERKKLELDEVAVEKILKDLLSAEGGIADILSGEKMAGLYSTSVAQDQASNFAAQVVGELAKLTAEQVTTAEGTQFTKATTKEKGGGGILGAIEDTFKGLF